jgi:hypothetical protein
MLWRLRTRGFATIRRSLSISGVLVRFLQIAGPAHNPRILIRIVAAVLRRDVMIEMPRRFWVLGMLPDVTPSCVATSAAVGMLCLELFFDRGGKF